MKSSRERELQQLRDQGLAKKRSLWFESPARCQRSVSISEDHDECISTNIAQQQQNGTKYIDGSKNCDDDGEGLGFLLSLSSASSDGSHVPSNEIGPNDSITSTASSITSSSIAWHEVHMQNREMKVFQHQFRDILFGSVGLEDEKMVLRDHNSYIGDARHDGRKMQSMNPPLQRKASTKGFLTKKCLPAKYDPPGYERMTPMDPPIDEEMMASIAGHSLELQENSGSTTDSLSSFEYASHENSYFSRILKKVKRWHRRRSKSQYQSMNDLHTQKEFPDNEAKIFAQGQETLTTEKEYSAMALEEKDKKSSLNMDQQNCHIPEKRSSRCHMTATIICHRYGYQFLVSVTTFLLLVGAITAVIVLSKSGTTPPSPLQSRRQVLRTMIEMISGIESLSNSSNPQYQAFEWMSTVDSTVLDSSPLLVAKTAERYIASLLYFATKGEEWTEQYDFLSPGPVCRWNDGGSERVYRHGIVCDDNGNVLRIQLSENNLVGTLPQELERLEYLEFLHLPRNHITTTIPNRLDFPNLQHLDLKSNQISGSLPTELGLLRNLRYLNLGSNRLEGSIPSTIGRLTRLEFLSLDQNMLGKSIPNEIGNLELSKTVDLSFNKLEGTVPYTLQSLAALLVLRLHHNLLTGDLDTEFCSRDYVSFTADCLETVSPSIICSCCHTCCDETVCCGASGCRNI